MTLTLRFDEPGSDLKARVGGKGANLGLCAQHGFPVPPGFTVTTDGYASYIAESGIDHVIARALDGADCGSATDDLEVRTAAIRAAIASTTLPEALVAEIGEGYAALGADRHVAVRSSGTAEDLAEASFAGMHDTFLNVQGSSALLDAVRACWASLWTTRALVYRHTNGLNDIAAIRMAVVVQAMVEPEVSGVMFTANPITTATDEIVINASWGLGEAVVQGIVTPDEYVVKAWRPLAHGFHNRLAPKDSSTTLRVKQCTTGTKELRMVRNPRTAQGIVTQDVPPDECGVRTLTDEQAIELAELGRRVQSFYEDMPQDIEWALLDGSFYLLQSRPITGVAFDWAADMDSFQWAPDNPADLWTDAYAEQVTGAKSPLYYQWVTSCDSAGYYSLGNLLGIPELSGPSLTGDGSNVYRPARLQVHKYHRGELYHSTEFEKVLCKRLLLPALRPPEISRWIAPEQAEEVRETPFSYQDFVQNLAKVAVFDRDAGVWGVLHMSRRFVDGARELSDYTKLPEMASLSDEELKRRIDEQFYVTTQYGSDSMILWMVYAGQMTGLFSRMIRSWYTGTNENAYAELCQGVSVRSKTLEENLGIYRLAEEIRRSETLSALFIEHPGTEFFRAAEACDEGRTFLGNYREFVSEHGHRGHEDRCFSYPRRWEDPSIDYRSFALMLSHEHQSSPLAEEEQLNAQRQAAYEDVVRNLKTAPLTGALKAAAFTKMYDWVQAFLAIRDDERWAYEMSVLCAKLYFREVGRRCVERGILADAEDFVMFTKDELFDMLDGHARLKLVQAKAAQRRLDHNRALERTKVFPPYLRDGREVAVATSEGDGGLIGTGWTSGTVTATARVVYRLSEINRVQPGEILVCQSTDPGWTPVFMLLSGIVIESGGVLSHAVCLSREYGLAAVQLPGARKLIPDGATVTINGSTGEINIVDEPGSRPNPLPLPGDHTTAPSPLQDAAGARGAGAP